MCRLSFVPPSFQVDESVRWYVWVVKSHPPSLFSCLLVASCLLLTFFVVVGAVSDLAGWLRTHECIAPLSVVDPVLKLMGC